MHRKQAFTLVELMIAVALMVILTGSIVFVFTQAQRIYTRTNAAVKVYQNARAAIDIMERDFANMIRSMEMEFWGPDKQDALTQLYNGHLDNTQENYQLLGQAGSQQAQQLRLLSTSDVPYLFSMVIAEGAYQDKSPGAIVKNRPADSIYFKTETAIPGRGTRVALVRYGLDVDPNFQRPPILMRWVAWVEKVPGNNPNTVNIQVRYEPPQPLCYYVTELKIEFFVKNRRRDQAGTFCRPSEFYGFPPAEEVVGGSGGGGSPSNPIFLGDISRVSFMPKPASPIAGPKGQIQYYYFFSPLYMNIDSQSVGNPANITPHTSFGSLYQQSFRGVIRAPLSGEPYFTFSDLTNHTDPNNTWNFFYQLGKGDKIFIFGSELDTSSSGRPHYYILPGEYTIKDIRKDVANQNQLNIYFREAIDVSRLLKKNPPVAAVSYRAVWIPSAIRITMKVIDGYAVGAKRTSRTIVRVFRVLGS